MKTPSTNTLATYLTDLIESTASYSVLFADCFTLTIRDGSIYRYTDVDVPVLLTGNTFVANSIQISGLKYKIACGVDVDEQDISIAATDSDTLAGVPFLQALRLGVLDGATLQRDRAFLPAWGQAAIGGVTLFHGLISTVEKVGRTEAQIKVKSDLVVLDIDYPRNLYSASCLHTLFDSGCALVKATFAVTGAVGSGSDLSDINWSGATAGYYDQGTVLFTSGPNAGASRNVKHSDGSKLILSYPLANAAGVGDTFTAYPGCDHTTGSGGCAKFSNLAHFRGFPFVPPPETGV